MIVGASVLALALVVHGKNLERAGQSSEVLNMLVALGLVAVAFTAQLLRHHFRRRVGLTPTAYRRRFAKLLARLHSYLMMVRMTTMRARFLVVAAAMAVVAASCDDESRTSHQ